LHARADVAANMQKLLGRSESSLFGLRTPEMLSGAGELAQAAHSLAGAAGTFGFLSIAAAARQFEHAADTGGP
jgi:HPt (histidine-containing phosphotransfer) domain-containing protein